VKGNFLRFKKKKMSLWDNYVLIQCKLQQEIGDRLFSDFVSLSHCRNSTLTEPTYKDPDKGSMCFLHTYPKPKKTNRFTRPLFPTIVIIS